MKKKFLVLLLIAFLNLPALAEPVVETSVDEEIVKPIEVGITFDWISKSQLQRDENIDQIRGILFQESTISRYEKKEFRQMYAQFLKEKNYLSLYEEIPKGKKEDETRNYCGFYVGKILIAYGIQYKNNMKNIFYYDVMGNLRWVDVFSENYPKFPYWSYQYYRDGKMVAAYYYVSDYDQYVFSQDKKFKGRWYKDKMYNRNAKVIMTRTNW